MMLLLRSSGDEHAEKLRLGVLRMFAERLATSAGWHPEDPATDGLLLRAQLVLSASIGVAVMRYTGLAPLADATEQDLTEPLRDLVNAVLRH
jgi:hypothetical protein